MGSGAVPPRLEEVGGFPWTPHDFVGLDLGSSVEGSSWCEGISTLDIDIGLATCGIFPPEDCSVGVGCDFDWSWGSDLGRDMGPGVDFSLNVELDWNWRDGWTGLDSDL